MNDKLVEKMAKFGKKYKKVVTLFGDNSDFKGSETFDLLKKGKIAKFDESVDVAFNLGVDPKHADQMVRGAISLPHGTGKTFKVAVFAKGEKAKEAQECGADVIGAEDLAAEVTKGQINFDKVVATPDMMAIVGRLGKVLGPRGLMPNPKLGTVTMDVTKAVKDIKAGKIEYKVDKNGVLHAPIGKMSFAKEKLFENFNALLNCVIKAKPSTAKGVYLKKISISSTMGPSIKIDPNQAVASLTK